MLAEMIEKIVSLKETKTFDIEGFTYSDRPLTRIPSHFDHPETVTLSSLASLCAMVAAELDSYAFPLFVTVSDHNKVEVISGYLDNYSRHNPYKAIADVPGFRGGWRDRETAMIELRSLFIPNEDSQYLLDLLSRMTDESKVTTTDNGVTQQVETASGVALKTYSNIKSRVKLQPFRTFLEVEQPESEFILRVDQNRGVGLFEADGGAWKLEAKKNIYDNLSKQLKDLVQANKVVVTQ